MHSSGGSKTYVYKDASMASPVLSQEAEIINTSEGKKLIMHFNVAEIMGATAYATGLNLSTIPFELLGENQPGDIKTEFLLQGDNSAICIVTLPNIEEKVYEGHIYSNIMNNNVAVRIAKVKKTNKTTEQSLNELIAKAESMSSGKEYYPNSRKSFDKVMKTIKSSTKHGDDFISLIKAMAGLREKLENPFADGKLSFVPVQATSAFAAPPGSQNKLLKPWARVTIVDGKPKMELTYSPYSDFAGLQALSDFKILDKDGEHYMASDIKIDENNVAKVTFDMDFFPESGVYKTKIYNLNGREYESDLILDFGNVVKDILPSLLEEAIKEVDYYQSGWVGAFDARISVDRVGYYTESSMNEYIKVIKKCEDDLKPENRVLLTQEIIDNDIKLLKEAKKKLVYKAGAGIGSNSNIGVSGLSKPGNVYESDQPQVVEAPWVGAKVNFGGKRYKVLNTGERRNSENNLVETGNLLLMADNFTVNKPWLNTEPSSKKSIEGISWKDSDIRKYLNNEFYNSFSELEKSMIRDTELETREAKASFITVNIDRNSNPITTTDKVFLLDVDEMKSGEFGFTNEGARKNSNYYFTRNLAKVIDYFEGEGYKIVGVKPKGNIETFNQNLSRPTEAYPVMNLDKSKILMTLQAGKSLNNQITPVEKTEDNVWDLVIKDEKMKLNVTNTGVSGNKVRVNYTTDTTTEGLNLVVFVVSGGDLQTGKIKSIGKVGVLDASGEIIFKVPGLYKGEDKLFVAAMDLNSPTKTASNVYEVNVDNLGADKSELFSLIREAKRKNVANYTDDTVAPMTAALADAKAKFDDSNVAQKDVDAAAQALDAALKALVKKPVADKIEYKASLSMKKNNQNDDSMAANAVDKIATIVEEGNENEITMVFKPMKFMGLEGHLLKMAIGGKEVKVIEKDTQGRPTKISFIVKGKPKRITAEVEVDAMNEINSGKSAPQKVDIVLDWDKKTDIEQSAKLERLAGKDRFQTSVEISKKYFKTAENVVLVSASNYADALVSAAYSKSKDAPTLLSGRDSINEDILNEIKRLGAKNITIIGGESSISNSVMDQLKALGLTVERIAGSDRYETSQKLAERLMLNNKSTKVAIVNGSKNADALAVSSLATKDSIPVIMVRNSDNNQALAKKLVEWNIAEVVAIGGENSISDAVLNALTTAKKSRIAGDDRYETALMIAKASYEKPASVFVSSGEVVIDALSTGVVTYKEKAPIVLVKKDSMKNNVKEFIKSIKNKIVVGGDNTISNTVEAEIK